MAAHDYTKNSYRYFGGKKNVIFDASDAIKGLAEIGEDAKKVVQATVSDVRSRGPGWIQNGVKKEYNVNPQGEIKKSLVSVYSGGLVNLGGFDVDNVTFKYSGRFLTPVHFGMNPTRRPKTTPYSITMEVLKSKGRKTIHGKSGLGKPFLAKNPNGPKTIVWQRANVGGKVVGRLPIVAFKTVSIPQMIQDGKGETKPAVQKELTDGIKKRFDHHFDRFMLR